MASTRTGVSAHQAHLLDSSRGGDIRRSKSSRRRCSRWPGFIAGPWGIGLRRWVRVGKPPSCRSARVGTRRGGRHLAPLSRPPWRVFFSPFFASSGPCLLGGRPGQPGAEGQQPRHRPPCRAPPRILSAAPCALIYAAPPLKLVQTPQSEMRLADGDVCRRTDRLRPRCLERVWNSC